MTKRIFIVGGNGFAKECVQYVRWNIATGADMELGGLVGHNGYLVDFGNELNELFVGDLSKMNFGPDDYCVIGAGYPELRRKIYNDIVKQGGQFINLCIGCFIPDGVSMGPGNIFISTQLNGYTGIEIGNGNLFNGNVVVGHDSKIGDFNFLGPSSHILGDVKIGDDNTIGTNAIILAHAAIGNNNKIAPLACVYKGCKNNAYMFGNPAEKVGTVE